MSLLAACQLVPAFATGLIAGVALPRLNVNQYRVDAGVRSVASMLTQAQRMAVTQQYNVNVLFITDQNAIRMHEDVDNDNVIDGDERVATRRRRG